MTINPNNKLNDNDGNFNELSIVLKQIGVYKNIGKGELILTEGEMVDNIYLIESGYFRTFRWINNQEVTIGFSFEGDIDTCPYAYFNQKESLESIEALTGSRVIKVHRQKIQELQRQYPNLDKHIQNILCHYIEILIQRNIDLRTKSANELYKELHRRQPNEVPKIPLMYIASYLGISKERLSRIRKNFNPID